jgi:hypothetical protein
MIKAVQLRVHNVVTGTGLLSGRECYIHRSNDRQRTEAAHITILRRAKE